VANGIVVVMVIALAIPFTSGFASTNGLPALTVAPGSGPVGLSVTLAGSSFPARTKVQITWDGAPIGMPRTSTTARGAFQISVTIPKGSNLGDHVLGAMPMTNGSKTSRLSIAAVATLSQATFDVTSSPPPTPSPTPTPVPTASPTAPPSAQPTPVPTQTPDPTATPTPVPTATSPLPTGTSTPVPTVAVTPAPTPLGTPGPTSTPLPVPSVTPPPVSLYPANTSLSYRATPSVACPAYLSPVTDPTLGTTTIRVSNIAGVRQSYSRLSAWNADGSKIFLGFTYPGRMLDGHTYADLGSFAQISGAIWSNVDPNKLYGVDAAGNGDRLYSQNATTGALTVLHAFTGFSNLTIGGYEGAVSDDDRYIVLIATSSTNTQHILTYDMVGGAIVGDMNAPAGLDNAQISRKGNYVVVVGSFGTRRYMRDLSSYITLYPYGNHGDNALDANGNEIFVANSTGNGVESFRLSDGAMTILLPEGSAFGYGHVSGRDLDRPGWVYLSVYDDSATAGKPGNDEVVALKTDGSGTVEVFAFAHHTDTTTYAMQPHAVPSRDGTRVLFASEWGGTSVFAYVASR
jgi:hypothetical protein